MAKPIRETPVLRGKDAIRFIKRMHEVETSPPTKADKEMLKRLKENAPFLKKMFNKKNK